DPVEALLVPGRLVVDGGEELRARDAVLRARLLHPRGGEPRVEPVAQRLLDQRLEYGIVEHLPPGRVRERAGVRDRARGALLAVEAVRHGHQGPLVVRADRAAGDQDAQRARRRLSHPRRHAAQASDAAGAGLGGLWCARSAPEYLSMATKRTGIRKIAIP